MPRAAFSSILRSTSEREAAPHALVAPEGAAMAAVNALTASGLFIGQPASFFTTLQDLATKADQAERGVM